MDLGSILVAIFEPKIRVEDKKEPEPALQATEPKPERPKTTSELLVNAIPLVYWRDDSRPGEL